MRTFKGARFSLVKSEPMICKRLTIRSFLAILCLLASLFAFTAESEGKVTGENSVETKVEVEEGEAFSFARNLRLRLGRTSKTGSIAASSHAPFSRATCRFFLPANERDRLNGLGAYLRT